MDGEQHRRNENVLTFGQASILAGSPGQPATGNEF
jgi:hypothetical protein